MDRRILDPVHALILEHNLTTDDIASITVNISDKEAHVFNIRDTPAVILQYLIAGMILDRTVNFASANDETRIGDQGVDAIKSRVCWQPSANLQQRQPIVRLQLISGRNLEHRTAAVRGTLDSPMDQLEISDKAFDVFSGSFGWRIAGLLIDLVRTIETVLDVRDTRYFLMSD